ncbi:putative nucleoredoxin 1 [Apium graveolens]|uniref:putative nucleoredoxin 1 n=1 Tax=Apium graveolens TaxID=4045 RepID=UPI003D79938F
MSMSLSKLMMRRVSRLRNLYASNTFTHSPRYFQGDLRNKKIAKEEAKGGHDQDMMMQTNTDFKKMEWFTWVNKGDAIHLNGLFTQNRDYLIKYNGQKVKAGELADKVIALYFVPLLADSVLEKMATTHLVETYNYLRPHNVFEVVLVAYETDCCRLNPEELFEAIFFRMPWPAIPFSDITSRERLSRRYDTSLDSFVFDSTGMLLQSYCLSIFNYYGGQGYPFSNGRIEFLKAQDYAIAEQPSLKMLLASPGRDYVITNKGDKVLIDTLEEKVVALYFYEEGQNLSWLTEIKLAYEEFAEKKKEFEVVLIYLYDTEHTCDYANEESFLKTFKSMPWLALPFKDPTYRKLKRLFGHNTDPGELVQTPLLVIIGPHGKYIEPWGADILMRYKLPAYPFTREAVAKLETEKVKELKLEMLWDWNALFRRNDGTEVPLYELVDKRIIIFFEGKELYNRTIKFLEFLKTRYARMRDMKGADDEFEVIYIISGKRKALYEDMIFDLPWLFALESEVLPVDLRLYCCYCRPEPPYGCGCRPDWCGNNSALLAFDRDGRLIRKSVNLYFDETDFPFYDADMEEEVLLELNNRNWWELDSEYRGLLINSLYKQYSG